MNTVYAIIFNILAFWQNPKSRLRQAGVVKVVYLNARLWCDFGGGGGSCIEGSCQVSEAESWERGSSLSVGMFANFWRYRTAEVTKGWQQKHPLRPKQKYWNTIHWTGQISVKFSLNIHGPLRIDCNEFSDSMCWMAMNYVIFSMLISSTRMKLAF